jgi:hypothetical protein
MDSLAPVIGWLKRNKFWIGSALLSILMLVGWYLASTEMQAAKKKQISKYSQSFSKIQNIRRVSAVTVDDGAEADVVAHPNSKTAEKMEEQLEATVEAVVEAWRLKRERQEPLMQFSKELLGEDTYQFLSSSKAPELLSNGEHYGTQNEKYLKTFRQQIPKKVSEIARHIRANWAFDAQRIEEELKEKARLEEQRGEFGVMGGMSDRGMGMMGSQLDTERNKFAVIWDEPNQRLWNTLLTDFQNWDDNVKASVDPTLLQVHMLQQDVWLLEAMFNVIRELNGNATTNDLAVIKEIRHIAFGREALANLGQIMEPDKRLGGAKLITSDGMGDDDYMDGDYSMDDMGDFGSMDDEGLSGEFSIDGDESPFHGRYVNVDLEPVNAEEIRNVVGGEELPEENLELIVSKRVPFRLAMKMDERRINSFLALCANSPFEFEVLQLRINRAELVVPIEARGGKTENKSAADVDGMAGMMSDMGDMMGGMSEMMGGDMMGGMMGMQAQKLQALVPTEVETRLSYDVDVEFYGVVKIYNPVRENYLRKAVGLEPEGEDEDSEEAALDSVAIREL